MIWNFDYGRSTFCDPLNFPDDVDVVDLLHATNVVSETIRLSIETGGDYPAEIHDVKWLSQIMSGSRNGKQRRLLHTAGPPTQMLAIEPAKHQCRPQDAMLDSALDNELLLGLLGFRVEIFGAGINDR